VSPEVLAAHKKQNNKFGTSSTIDNLIIWEDIETKVSGGLSQVEDQSVKYPTPSPVYNE
jgi:hypothetical protein